ncbi:LADA_0B08240g1_1 [Lachancea dasiensis]|uniref:LADA_0B08240g1_1 n=1 Tax=Lachancea dasiensis TaxID=1072105 RepID=A0A1G4IUM2_9SACH|nr:LADA_0B08240g1_1 [Lachancea dasiensis]
MSSSSYAHYSVWDQTVNIVYVVEMVFYCLILFAAVAALFRRSQIATAAFLILMAVLKICGLSIALDLAVRLVKSYNSGSLGRYYYWGGNAYDLAIAEVVLLSLSIAALVCATVSLCFAGHWPIWTHILAYGLVALPAILYIVVYALVGSGVQYSVSKLIEAADVLYLALYVIIVITGGVMYAVQRKSSDGVRFVGMLTVMLAVPFFLVRLIYYIVNDFGTFLNITGWKFYLPLQVVMEFMVSLIYVVGLHFMITRHHRIARTEVEIGDESTEGTKSHPTQAGP